MTCYERKMKAAQKDKKDIQGKGDKRIPKQWYRFGAVCTFCHSFSLCRAVPALADHKRLYSGGLEMMSTWAVPSLSGMLLCQLSLPFQPHCQQHFHEKTLVWPAASIPPETPREATVGVQPLLHAACLPPCSPRAQPVPWLHSAFKFQFLWRCWVTEFNILKGIFLLHCYFELLHLGCLIL